MTGPSRGCLLLARCGSARPLGALGAYWEHGPDDMGDPRRDPRRLGCFMAIGWIVATVKTFAVIGLIAVVVVIVVWLLAGRPRRG
jgi:hypothetical protein